MSDTLILGIITTHPIQYQVPLFRELGARSGLQIEVFFEHIPDPKDQGKGFETSFTWDLDVLQGYSWKVLNGKSREGKRFSDLAQAYRAVDVMLVHGWQSNYMRWAWWKGLRSDVPLLVRGDSNSMKPRPWPLHMLHRLYLQPFQGYLYVGESNRWFYLSAGVSEESLHFSPRSVENQRFDEDWRKFKASREALRTKMNISDAAICFLFCGKFIEKKRPTDVVEAFENACRRTDVPMHLLMVGDGKLHDEVKAQVTEKMSVTFTGFLNQTEIGEAYTAADVLVLPSNYGETWGLVVNEGMIFECPAIVSDRVGCGPDLIQEGETGYTVPFADTDTLADRMIGMARHPDQTRKMGEQARELIMSDYTIERAADGIVCAARDVYEQYE